MEVVGILLKNSSKVNYFLPGKGKISRNKKVIVKTEYGYQLGTVIKEKENIKKEELEKIVRVATKKDIEKYNKNIIDAEKARIKANKLIKKHNIDIKIIDATYTLDRDKLVFRFISDKRVDFRELVTELAQIYRTRIELKQIGSRDKAKEIGGCGQCGKPLCCATFLNKIDSIAINMAKNQNIALNPSKINGVCGRLLCCLKYENESYMKNKAEMPNIGDEVETKKGKGKVISLDILNKSYKIYVEKVGIIEEKIDESHK